MESPGTATWPCWNPASVGLGGATQAPDLLEAAGAPCAAWAGRASTAANAPDAPSATTRPPMAYRRHPRPGMALRSSRATATADRLTACDMPIPPIRAVTRFAYPPSRPVSRYALTSWIAMLIRRFRKDAAGWP